MKRWAWLLMAALIMTNDPVAAEKRWDSWQIIEANDNFAPPGRDRNDFNMQSFRATFTRTRNDTFDSAESVGEWWRKRFWGNTEFVTLSSVVFGHEIFTPGIITTFDVDPADRPYASLLYGGVRIDMVGIVNAGSQTQSLELDVGFLGSAGLGEPVQKGFHALQQTRMAKGWDSQLGTEVIVNAHYMNRRQYGWGPDDGIHVVDVTRDVGLALGTFQIYPVAGATFRFGYNMTGMAASSVSRAVTASERPRLEFGFMGGIEGRYFLRNAYLDGNLIGGEPSVDKKPFVYDWKYGVHIRIESWRLSYTAIRRSQEFEPVPSGQQAVNDFGLLAISREFTPSTSTKLSADRGFWSRDWLVEVGIGGGTTRLLSGTDERTSLGPSSRFGVAKGLRSRFTIGGQVTAMTHEGALNTTTGEHRDSFLTSRSVVLGVRPFASTKPGLLRFTIGVGQGVAKIEETRGGEVFRELSEKGVAFEVGAEYAFSVSDRLSLGLNTTWVHLSIDKPVFDRATFMSTAVVAQWHP